MSEDVHVYATPDLTKVRYGRGEREQDMEERGEKEGRGEWKERTVDIYVTAGDLDPDPGTQKDAVQKNPAREQRGGSHKSKNRLYRAAAVCLGLLCLLLSVAISVLVIHFSELIKKENNLVQDLESRYNNLTNDPDELKRILCELSGWKTFGRVCYYISTEKKTWDDSRQYCRGKQSDLMVINRKEKQDLVISFNKIVWLGLKKEGANWKWLGGTPLTTPMYWGPYEPNGMPKDGEHSAECAVLVADNSKWHTGWYDRPCSHTYHWICERVLL